MICPYKTEYGCDIVVDDIDCDGSESEMSECCYVEDPGYDNLLWDILKAHAGHKVEIAIYGDPNGPANISLEDMDTNEVILDAGIYTICARED